MRWLALIVGMVFIAAGIKALVAYDPTTATLTKPMLLIVAALGSTFFLILFAKAGKSGRQLSQFEQWLTANAAKIQAGGASYQGQKVTTDTEVKRFLLTISIVFMTFKIPSRYYFATRDNFLLTQTLYTVASLLFGWWGIPWGPIYTIQAVAKNLTGGYTTTVGAYLATAPAQKKG